MPRIAFPATLATLLCILTSVAARAEEAPHATLLHLDASHIDFYQDRFLLEADGNVHVQTSDGFTVTGDTFSMDLKLNRFLVAGHVTLHDASGTVSGAAISDFLDFQRIYFVPVTSQPDRWTFLNGDLVHPAKGREMPGDAFFFPVVNQHPSITASSAIVDTKTYVRFIGANSNLAGVMIPLGSEVVNFSSNQYFAQNTLSGASVDLTWTVAGSPNALTALHLRYDPTYKTYGSVEQHFVGAHDYAIFSVNPATRAEKWWNAMLYEKLGSRFQIQTFTQFYTQQVYLAEPAAAQQTTYINATYALPHSYLQATSQLTNYNLLGPDSLVVKNTVAGSLDHPSQLQLSFTSFQNKVGKLPLYEQIYGGYGFNHDTVGGDQYTQGSNGIPPIPFPDCKRTARPVRTSTASTNPPNYYYLPGIYDDLEYGRGLQPLHAVAQAQPGCGPVSDLLFQRKPYEAASVELAAALRRHDGAQRDDQPAVLAGHPPLRGIPDPERRRPLHQRRLPAVHRPRHALLPRQLHRISRPVDL